MLIVVEIPCIKLIIPPVLKTVNWLRFMAYKQSIGYVKDSYCFKINLVQNNSLTY